MLGQWSDGNWYPANIANRAGNEFELHFDDGDKATVEADQIKRLYWHVGTRVECNWKRGGTYYPGTISRMDREVIHVMYDDGDREDTTVSTCRSK